MVLMDRWGRHVECTRINHSSGLAHSRCSGFLPESKHFVASCVIHNVLHFCNRIAHTDNGRIGNLEIYFYSQQPRHLKSQVLKKTQPEIVLFFSFLSSVSNSWLVQLSELLKTEQISYFPSCLFKYKWMQLKWVLVVKYSKERGMDNPIHASV